MTDFEEKMRRLTERAKASTERVESLIRGSESQNQPLKDDMLRAAVVLTHATLEEYLRTLTRYYLPFGKEEAFADLCLPGLKSEKFRISDLAKFRDRTVIEVIMDSVEEHLEHATYNNKGDVKKTLELLDLWDAAWEKYLPSIQEMMLRRHQIAHRADLDSKGIPESISGDHVYRWATSFIKLAVAIKRKAITDNEHHQMWLSVADLIQDK